MEYPGKALRALVIFIFLMAIAGCAAQRPGGPPPELPSQRQGAMPSFDDSLAQSESPRPVSPQELPPLVIPSPYQAISPFDGAPPVSLQLFDAPLREVLATVAEDAGLNVVFHQGVPQAFPLSLTLDRTPVEEALEIIMDISGCYYQLRGQTLHVHRFVTRTFNIPYVNTRSSFVSNLGGDVLGGSGTGANYRGEFSMRYDNPEEMNDFSLHIQENVEKLLSEEGRYVLNRFSGVLNVTDHHPNVQNIEQMLERILEHSFKQVLIEAQIFEVVLNDSHSLGIDWTNAFSAGSGVGTIGQVTGGSFGLPGGDVATGVVQYTRNNFTGMLQVMRNAGNLEALSNPRIRVMNSQTAIISSGRITPFWTKRVDYSEVGGQINRIETYDRRDVLSGISMGVTPVIAPDGSILLTVIPVSTNFEEIDQQTDSSGDLIVSAPVVNMKEAGTIIRVQDNDMVVIGGLISTSTRRETQEVSGLSAIPLLGHLFRGSRDVQERRELVIFLRIRSVEI